MKSHRSTPSPQSLREEHQGYEKELSRLRATYEEEMLRFKEAQVRTLEEMEEKHQAMTEEAQQEKEEEKKLLVTVGALLTTTICLGSNLEAICLIKVKVKAATGVELTNFK